MTIRVRNLLIAGGLLILLIAWLAWPLYRPLLWIPLQNIPPSPVLSPELALQSFDVAEGYTVELVASEPLLESPVVIKFDPAGNIWAAEMNTYMTDVYGSQENLPIGRIVILQDSDGDRVMDTRSVVLDDVVLPRALAFVPGGFLYADQQQLYYVRLQGYQVVDRVVVDPDYAAGGDVEHKPNGLVYGLDNWIYSANAFQRYRFFPAGQALPEGPEVIHRDEHWTLVRDLTQYRGQWGISVDDYGRLVYNHNHTAAYYDYLRPNSLPPKTIAKQDGTVRASTGDDRFELGSRRVYPARVTPGVNLGYKYGVLDRDGKLKKFTAAGGPSVYRGTNFPDTAYGLVFVTEPAANLVAARRAIIGEGTIKGAHFLQDRDMLASTDERFRPVHTATAPDGSLYIVDMYHGITQHDIHLTRYLENQILQRGLDKDVSQGRIYRLRYGAKPLQATADLGQMSSAELLQQLAHPNGWQRDTAKRLLIERQDQKILPALEQMAAAHPDHRAQITALWTLEGLNALRLETLRQSLSSEHVQVGINALAVGEYLGAEDQPAYQQLLEQLASADLDYPLTLQLALSASRAKSRSVLQTLHAAGDSRPFIAQAIASDFASDAALQTFLETGRVSSASEQSADASSSFSAVQKAQIIAGEELYFGAARCLGCHGAEGEGIGNIAPPLVHSEWVLRSEEQLLAILLHGLSGPITVNGKHYQLPGDMPGLAADEQFSDADIAALASYLRNAWGNRGSLVSEQLASRVRAKTLDRSGPYSARELEQMTVH